MSFYDSEAVSRIGSVILEPNIQDCSCPINSDECCGECTIGGCFCIDEMADTKAAMVAESMAWERQEMEGFK